MNRARPFLLFAILTLASSSPLLTVANAADSSQQGTLSELNVSTDIRAALLELEDEDFNTRKKAIQKIEAIFSQQTLDLMAIKSAEAQASLLPALSYNEDLIRWLEEILSLSAEQQSAQFRLARVPGMLKATSGLFSRDPHVRVAALRGLAGNDDPDLDWEVARSISDGNRQVSLTAMDLAWDRKPTPMVAAALWDKAVEAGSPERRAMNHIDMTSPLIFRGERIGFAVETREYPADSNVATAVLIHTQATIIHDRVAHFFAECLSKMNAGPSTEPFQFPVADINMQCAFALAQQFKVREAVPLLYRLATAQKGEPQIVQDEKGDRFQTSNRIEAIVMFLILTDQPHPMFTQKGIPLQGRMMWVARDEHAEEAALTGIQAWWKEHGKELTSG